MTKDQFENYITRFPIYQYRFLSTEEIPFYDKNVQMCKKNCPYYKTSWSCPPAVGKVDECKEALRQFPDAVVISCISSMKNPLSGREARETQDKPMKITADIENWLIHQDIPFFTLTSDVCRICPNQGLKCGYSKIPCRNPEQMHPCIEGYGILLTDLLIKLHMDYDIGERYILWYTIIFFNAELISRERLEELKLDRILTGKIENLSMIGAEINEELILTAERTESNDDK